MFFLEILIILLGTYASLYCIYTVVLVLARFLLKEKKHAYSKPVTKFAIIIPAYNEELLLSRLLKSIQKQNYPRGLFDSIVVADNCTDNTAQVAKQNHAIVIERSNEQNKGKGFAIEWALKTIDLDHYSAALIIDADSIIASDALQHLDGLIRKGQRAFQCYNGVANPDDSWFTRLLDVSRTVSNEIFHPAKQKLGFSSYLMGNGICFTTEVLQKYGWDAFTVGEDWEYYAKLIQNGEVINFAHGAKVYHRESSSLKQATSQRMRWSSGRFAIAWEYGLKLLLAGLAQRSIVKFDAALPLLFPNPSLGMNITLLGLIASFILPADDKYILVVWFLALILMQVNVFVIGVFFTNNKLSKFMSIFIAPVFLTWKMIIDILSALGIGRKEWIRTERKC